jgi:glycosyltransferase involved in cell wall biosynthesis
MAGKVAGRCNALSIPERWMGKFVRVLQIIDSLNRGGAEVMLTAMAPRFRTRGVTCDVIALIQRPSPLEQSLLNGGVSLRYSGVRQLYSPRQIFALSEMLGGYDLVHVHLFPAQLWAALAAVRSACDTPLVTTEHSTWNARRRWWLRPVDRWMYSQYRRIACISEATERSLVQWCPDVAKKVTVIPNGVPLEEFENARPAALDDVPPGVIRVVFVGRCVSEKDHPTLLRALVAVPKAYLFLVGDGPLRLQLEQMAQSLGIRDRVSFLGWRRDVAAVLKASDIYVHSTHSDGFGIAACEAMAAGLPVLASDVPGLADVVRGAGLLFSVQDDRALAQHLRTLIQSPELRREMSGASLQRARQFNIEKTVDGCIQLYESVLRNVVPETAGAAAR